MTTLVPQTFLEGITHNAEVALKSGSTYVVLIFGALAAMFEGLNAQQQQALLASFPLLSGYTPIIAAIATYVVTRLKPSSAVSTQTQALIDEIIRLKTNPVLAAAGQPTIPEPAKIPVPAEGIVAPIVVPKPDPMQTQFSAPPTVVDIPLPLGSSVNQPIHIMLHQVP